MFKRISFKSCAHENSAILCPSFGLPWKIETRLACSSRTRSTVCGCSSHSRHLQSNHNTPPPQWPHLQVEHSCCQGCDTILASPIYRETLVVRIAEDGQRISYALWRLQAQVAECSLRWPARCSLHTLHTLISASHASPAATMRAGRWEAQAQVNDGAEQDLHCWPLAPMSQGRGSLRWHSLLS